MYFHVTYGQANLIRLAWPYVTWKYMFRQQNLTPERSLKVPRQVN
jgi:hypothetical protein